MRTQVPTSLRTRCNNRSAKASKVAQLFAQRLRARKRTIWALWRGSMRMAQEAAEAECRPAMQVTIRRVGSPTVVAGSLTAAKKDLANGSDSAKIMGGLSFRR